MFSRSLSLEKWTGWKGDHFPRPQRLAHGGAGERQWRGVPARGSSAAVHGAPQQQVGCHSDGRRFLVDVQPGEQNGQAPINVVLNWAADLKH